MGKILNDKQLEMTEAQLANFEELLQGIEEEGPGNIRQELHELQISAIKYKIEDFKRGINEYKQNSTEAESYTRIEVTQLMGAVFPPSEERTRLSTLLAKRVCKSLKGFGFSDVLLQQVSEAVELEYHRLGRNDWDEK